MSFFGKNFKKVKSEYVSLVLGKVSNRDLSEANLALMVTPDSVTTFTKNADGTLHYVVKNGSGAVVLDQNITLASQQDFKSHGLETKVKHELDGDVLKSEMFLPGGKIVHIDRYFEAEGMKMELYLKGDAEKATIYYQVV